ncbi:hypothetical protein VNO78_00063 [Psophocarpus tetragonolobus]|uniref:Uncharacterized protein n=1 Tax=Psophocarpus tetragonolobus TaxID=3891 RepID=A0AAN9T7E3_PSOTE
MLESNCKWREEHRASMHLLQRAHNSSFGFEEKPKGINGGMKWQNYGAQSQNERSSTAKQEVLNKKGFLWRGESVSSEER